MISIVLTVFLSLYTLLILALIAGSLRPFSLGTLGSENPFPGVTIVVPFRNEAANLTGLISSLASQDYPGKIELLLIDDNSTDNFRDVLAKANTQCQFPVKVINAVFDTSQKLTSKQQALDTGITTATNALVALTDADMVLSPGWVRSLVAARADAGLVFGHTGMLRVRNTFFERMQAFQLEFLFSVAHAFFNTGMTGSAMGNNILLTKDTYEAIGGMNGIGYSIVEDRDLFTAVRKRGIRTVMTRPLKAQAHTYACATVNQFYHQMRRWVSGGINLRSNLLPVAIFFTIELISLALLPLLADIPAFCAGVNFFLTWAFICISFFRLQSKENPFLFPVFYLFLLAQIMTIGISFLFKPEIVWKERQLHK